MTDLAKLAAAWEIEQLMAHYLERVDARDPEGAAATFTEDGVADYLTGRTYQGRERIARVLGGILGHFERTSHHMSNHQVRIAGDTARAITYVYAFHRLAATGGTWHFWGRHVDRLVKVGGEWLIAERTLIAVDADPEREDVPRSLFQGHGAIGAWR
jgi:uncharacterized protein (TIGR02246 family)